MVTQQAAISMAQDFVKECQAIGLNFKKVLLFGSYAKGTIHEGSDIDLLLVSDGFTDNVFDNLRQYAQVNIRFPQVETHPCSYRNFLEGDEFLQQLMKEAVEIEFRS
jgi:predicted nucleotidyltransferase